MPRTRSLAWAELKIGFLAVLALVLAAVMVFLVGGQGGFFWQRYELRTAFPDVQGLKTGAVVRVAGVEVGKVTGVRFDNADVEVVMEVSREMQARITTESRASIGALSLLGEPLIDIRPSTRGEPIPPGGVVPSTRAPGQLADVAETATRGLEEVTRLLQDVREGEGTIGRLFTDESLYKELHEFMTAAEQVAAGLNRGDGTIGALLRDPAAYRSLEAALADLSAISGRISAGEGSLGRLVGDPALADSLASAAGEADGLLKRVSQGEGTAGRFVTDPELYDRLNAFSAQLERMMTGLQDGEGTAGRLLQDRQLYENMNSAASELRSLVADIRRDPRKYLNVRVSIF